MGTVKDCYQPGETNINRYEAQLRRESGVLGILIAVVMFVFLQIVDASIWWYALLFLPVTFSILGFMQARDMFCANYALRGLQNAARAIDEPSHIMSNSARELDKKRAKLMFFRASLLAVIVILVAITITRLAIL